MPIRVDTQLRYLMAIHTNVNVARIQRVHNISWKLLRRIGAKTIHNDIIVKNHQTRNVFIVIASKLPFCVLNMRPNPAPHFATKNLNAFFLNCLCHFFVRWVGLKLFDLDHNSDSTNHDFVIWKLASVGWCGKALRNVATQVAILKEQTFRFSLRHTLIDYTSSFAVRSSMP